MKDFMKRRYIARLKEIGWYLDIPARFIPRGNTGAAKTGLSEKLKTR